jgi:fructokinase
MLVELAHRYKLLAVALTKGGQGSLLYLDNTLVNRPAAKVTVADTVGAGDAYTAALTLGLLKRYSPERILEQAHLLAEYVCTQPGATPPLPKNLRLQCSK